MRPPGSRHSNLIPTGPGGTSIPEDLYPRGPVPERSLQALAATSEEVDEPRASPTKVQQASLRLRRFSVKVSPRTSFAREFQRKSRL